MQFVRYPDGSRLWTWFIWSRHARHSLTWTHSLTVSRHRNDTGERRFGLIRPSMTSQRHYGVTLFGIDICMTRQNPMPRRAAGR